MNQVALLSESDRRDLFSETAARKGMTPVIIEKDFWVCWTLSKIFEHAHLSDKVIFKGGTSLSKVFNLIERFSEDIDLVLNWDLLTDEDPREERSRAKQKKFNEALMRKTQECLKNFVLPCLTEAVGGICKVEADKEKEGAVNIHYPGVFRDEYLRREIVLEIGPRSDWIPHEQYSILPYAAEEFPNLFTSAECQVIALKAERTFWEKVTILHAEAFRPEGKQMPLRYSRHYYDLSLMSLSSIKESALEDLQLLDLVIKSKKLFFPSAWANYDLAKPGTMKLMPPKYNEKVLLDDYRSMKNMIFGKYPSFEEVLSNIKRLEEQINALNCY
ncbi:MAG: nucleotidyl transferase AbiEii/AbiGii toxin family protein [Candidatus Omnitrophota bacterium]